METTRIQAESRAGLGTRAARAFRKEGRLPAVIYGHNEPPEHVTLPRHELEVAIAHGARTLEVELGGQRKQYLIKEVQYDHLDRTVVHMDLARVDLHERVRVRVGVELRGIPKGAAEGGVLEQVLAEIEVECRVTDIPKTLHPLVSNLGVGDLLLVKDLELPPDVVAVTGPEERIATVRVPLAQPVAEVTAEAEPVVAEPERIGRIRKEEEPEA